MTDIMFTRTALTEAAKKAGVTTDQARTILETAGVTVQPEKPEPGTWHIVKDGPQVGDAARVDEDGYLHVIGSNGKTLRDIHPDNTWPDLTPARVVPDGEPIDLGDVRKGDRVRMELDDGEQITFTVKSVGPTLIESGYNHFPTSIIRTIHLLHREEA